ncbi:MAG: tRNA lysidine(34) synthetase TilS [Nitrospira sp.]
MAVTMDSRIVRTPWPSLLHRVVKTVRSRDLFEPGHHLLIAVSGGPDSVALLRLLHRLAPQWRLTLMAVHFNYGLRGTESEEDQAFVVALCRALAVPLRCVALNVATRPKGTSLQAHARALRYREMTALAGELAADRIALGHTADDQAETILLWMVRGSGLAGLSGMPAQREGLFIRPLYDVRRREILAYLQDAGQSYRFDSSNAKPLYTRNRIRHDLLPVIERVVPSALDALCRLGDLCREDERYLEDRTTQLGVAYFHDNGRGTSSIDRRQLLDQPVAIQRRLLRALLKQVDPQHRPAGFSTVEILRARLTRTRSGFTMRLAGALVSVTGGRVLVSCRQEPFDSGQAGYSQAPIMVASPTLGGAPTLVEWTGTGQQIQVQMVLRRELSQPARTPEWFMAVDADRVSGPLMIRSWRAGDRFVPIGMKQCSKKLQDFFVDRKVPKAQRPLIPILEAPEGILGVLGFRQDERFIITDETRRCLVISLIDSSQTKGVQ